MQIGWDMRLSARPPLSYARTTVLVLVLSMISGTSIQAAPTTSLPVPARISTTSTTTAPGQITSTTATAPKSTTSTTTTAATQETITSTKPTTTTTAVLPGTITTTTPTTTTTTAPPETITSATTAPKPTTTTTTAPPETITTTNVVPPPTTPNAAPTPTTPNAAPPPATTNTTPSPATPNTALPPATTTAPSPEPTPEMAVSTSAVPPNPTESNNKFSLLWKCSPLAYLTTGQSNVGLQSYNFILGNPVSNCLNGTTAIDSEISGSISTSDTWSPGLSVGLQFGPLSLTGSAGWTHTITRTYTQSITIHVPPAQQGALIAIVDYNVSSGHMKVGSTDVYPVFSNQPTGNVKYDSAVIGCGDTFNANFSAPLPISGSRSLRRPMSSSMLFMSAILVGITYVL
ncbi:hypothetical protein K443DRAFT_423429 [Laccaria amethystina LaAM-08-1]|uniref:Uncharacterized protein n=1 Tax=Laccaria amethystina LaAM-08-1 TaxID=1095629 RepID=A0A0C9WIB6_9AGAR|nr:hypothetical protein K443DRAFT_423429 [Laccaria amethystina LaAM-08-1]